jgi:hypothetical protein
LHTVTDDPIKSRQVAAAAKAANAEAGRRAVILGGDFNTRPGGMRALLDPARGGRFFDVDPERAPTPGDKIDYVLFDAISGSVGRTAALAVLRSQGTAGTGDAVLTRHPWLSIGQPSYSPWFLHRRDLSSVPWRECRNVPAPVP